MNAKISNVVKTLRKNSTKAERMLWKNLRTKQMEGFKFRRQEPIGNYVVDFVCFEKRIVREVIKDKQREKWLKKQGFKILRFWNNEVLRNIEGVIEVIRLNCLYHPLLTPLPSRERK